MYSRISATFAKRNVIGIFRQEGVAGKLLHTSRSNSAQAFAVASLQAGEEYGNSDRFHKLLFLATLAGIGAAASIGTTYCDIEESKSSNILSSNGVDNNGLKKVGKQDPAAWARDAAKANGLKIFTGNANRPLAKDIANHLGMSLGKIVVNRFADGEVNVVINENVRGKDVYIIQPTSPPVNETVMELLLMISTMRRASARKITAVIPYYGYARQDRKMQARVPISAADVARLLEAMGVDRVVAVDLHCGQIQGFFGPRVPVDNLDGGTVGVSYFGDMDLINPVIVSPDAGGVYRAKQFREALS
jgi:ribose-phosphate pyrophosphokinase